MLFKLLANIYTAGRTFGEAKPRIDALTRRGFSVTSDILGEFNKDRERIEQAVDEYLLHMQVLGLLQKAKGTGNIVSLAVKPSRIGLEHSYGVFQKNLHIIAEAAKNAGIFLWTDAEKKKDREIVTVSNIRERAMGFDNIGQAIQCVHSDAEKFIEELLKWNIGIRFVKGAYTDGDLKKDTDIVQNFKNCFWSALFHFRNSKEKATIAAATHDSRLIDYALRFREIDPDLAQFIQIQMLYGIRVKLWFELIRKGVDLLIYVPWGPDRIGFLKRRLKEGIQPGAKWLFIRNIFEAWFYRFSDDYPYGFGEDTFNKK